MYVTVFVCLCVWCQESQELSQQLCVCQQKLQKVSEELEEARCHRETLNRELDAARLLTKETVKSKHSLLE